MKHVLLLLAAFIMMAVSGLEARTMKVSYEPVTIRTRMQEIHDYYGVNFVYDSTLDLNFPSDGRKLTLRQDQLETCLAELFQGTGISYHINRKYIVLTYADSRNRSELLQEGRGCRFRHRRAHRNRKAVRFLQSPPGASGGS